jgi:hypothetical protein
MECDPELLNKLKRESSLRRKQRLTSLQSVGATTPPQIKMIVTQWYTDEFGNQARMIYSAPLKKNHTLSGLTTCRARRLTDDARV